MKLSEVSFCYARSPNLRAKLLKKIDLDNGITLKRGAISALLIDKGNGEYHFETEQTACTVSSNEIQLLS